MAGILAAGLGRGKVPGLAPYSQLAHPFKKGVECVGGALPAALPSRNAIIGNSAPVPQKRFSGRQCVLTAVPDAEGHPPGCRNKPGCAGLRHLLGKAGVGNGVLWFGGVRPVGVDSDAGFLLQDFVDAHSLVQTRRDLRGDYPADDLVLERRAGV